MRKILTFLGKKPIETHYEFRGQVYTGRVFAEAMRQFTDYDEMLVFVTDEARTETWPVLAALNDDRIRAVVIPRAENPADMWAIFDAITSQVNEGEVVIFDITHGLRSLPFLVFLFAAYLQTAKHVTIEAIYYGALELGDAAAGWPAPVIDMSQFVQMLDWLTATDQFTRTGDARRLARLLNPRGLEKGASFEASKKLSDVSLAAFLCQPFTLMREAQTLDAYLHAAEAELAAQAHPFGILREQITGTFGEFGADFQANAADGLKAQLRLIEWYYKNNQLIQAMTLGREWLISAVTYRLGQPIDLTRETRKQMEWAVSGLPKVGGPHPGQSRTFEVSDLNVWGQTIYTSWPDEELKTLTKLWAALEVVRNGLDHAEYQKGAPPLRTLEAKADKDVMQHLRALALKWCLA